MKTNIKFILMVLCGVLCIEAHAQSSHWQFDAYAYRYDMTAFVSLSIDGEMVTDYSDYEIAAFCDEECRGIASIQKVEKDGNENSYGYLRIRSNQDTGETITFKAFKVSTNQEMNVYNTSVVFRPQQVVGLPSTPMIIPVVHFSVSVSCDETMGTVSGGGVYEAGTTATLTATPIEGYHFANWSDGEGANPYEFIVTGDINLSASFAPSQYTMTFVLDNGEENVVKTQDYGTKLTAPADPTKTGFTFKGWSPELPATVPASNQTFTAQWERNSYKLTWDVDGVKTESMVLYEAPITKPDNPEKDGYTFAGWIPDVAETMPAEDVTYTATWTINQYSITYDLAGGALAEGETNPTSYTIESEDITLTNPTREGHTFAGWTGTDLTEATQSVTIAKSSFGNRSYTATWTVNQYVMTFVLDNGEENVVKTQDYGTELTVPADPTKTGFTFKGWSPEVPLTVPASNQTFTAQWERNSYKLTWDVDGVKTESMVLYEDPIIKPEDPKKDGYIFAGWTPDVAETMPAEDVTYTATWTINQYSITYDLAGGALAEGVTNPISYTIESESFTLTNPVREGYTFAGWVGTDLTEATPSVTITKGSFGNRSYTATWTVNQYTMTFVLDNGEENVVKTQDYGTELTIPADPTKTGFTFKGWSPEVPLTVPASNQTFTAQWERNSYKLTWDVDGVKTESMVLYEAPVTKPTDPEKVGYSFAGWTPDVAETMPAEDVTYTATWTINQYSITYDLAGGALAEGETNPTSYTIESEDITMTNPTREGHTFVGWTGTDLTEATQSVTIAKGSFGNRSYTATWTVNQYVMTFVLDNGEENVVMTQDYGTELTAPANPAKTGFTFKGWSPEVPATVPASNQTFTTQWERNSYKLTWDVDGVKTESLVLYEAPITKPDDPEKDGYTFAGWTPDVAETMPAEDVTYTATWTINQYSIAYDLAGGVLAEGETNPTSYTIESEDITLVNPTREGYTFEGWIGTDLAEPFLEVTIAKGSIGNRSYTATWTVSTVIMTIPNDSKKVDVYDLNGRLIRRDIPVLSLKKELPSGIYIIHGKKVTITK